MHFTCPEEHFSRKLFFGNFFFSKIFSTLKKKLGTLARNSPAKLSNLHLTHPNNFLEENFLEKF